MTRGDPHLLGKRLRGVLVALLAAGAPGCTSLIVPPAQPEHPVAVYLVKEARHRGLVLPCADGTCIEYGYGDWDWYACNATQWYYVFDTILWPTQGALGRRLAVPGGTAIAVEAAALEVLRADLEARFERSREPPRLNPLLGMRFVKVARGFWFGHNCNDEVADWLVRLGCSVSWAPIRIDMEVSDAPDE